MLVFLAVLPLLLSLGVAAQALGVYCATLVPALFFLRKGLARNDAQFLLQVAVLLALLWGIFPAFSLGHLLLQTHDVSVPSVRAFVVSRLSTSALVCSFIMFFAALRSLLKHREPVDLNSHAVTHGRLLWWLCIGMALSVCLVAPYFFYQSYAGFDYRSPGHLMEIEHRMPNGLYRLFGFYGHPLSTAGASLAFFSFAWYLLWNLWGEKTLPEKRFSQDFCEPRFGWASKSLPWALLVTSLGHVVFVMLSGGRTAMLVTFVLLSLVPFMVKMSKKANLVRMAVVFVTALTASVGLYFSGLASRFVMAYQLTRAGQAVDDRGIIWNTHLKIFRDFPWFGAGNVWLDAGLRTQYYQRFGAPEHLWKDSGYHAHNLFLQILCDVGIVGFVVVVFLLAAIAWNVWRQVRGRALPTITAKAFLVSFVANLLHGFTENTFFSANVLLVTLFLFLVVLWISVAKQEY